MGDRKNLYSGGDLEGNRYWKRLFGNKKREKEEGK